MAVEVGWFDNEGRFYAIHGATDGEFRPVETGLGPCVVKMRREDDPPDNVRPILDAKAKARAEPHKATFYAPKGDTDAAVFCTCGWESRISAFGYATKKASQKEAERRHNVHLKEVGRL
ncbi:hypothetical protein PCC82_06515 [Agrobacterium deltaense]